MILCVQRSNCNQEIFHFLFLLDILDKETLHSEAFMPF